MTHTYTLQAMAEPVNVGGVTMAAGCSVDCTILLYSACSRGGQWMFGAVARNWRCVRACLRACVRACVVMLVSTSTCVTVTPTLSLVRCPSCTGLSSVSAQTSVDAPCLVVSSTHIAH